MVIKRTKVLLINLSFAEEYIKNDKSHSNIKNDKSHPSSTLLRLNKSEH